MNKQDLVSAMSEKLGLPKKVSEFAINSFVESISEALANGESVQLIGFGTFKVGKTLPSAWSSRFPVAPTITGSRQPRSTQ